MSTGDMLNNLRCLQSCLRAVNIHLPDNRQSDLKTGVPDVYVKILRSILLEYSHHIAQLIASHHIQLSLNNNDRFIDGVYKVLRDIFNYKPSIPKDMFLRTGCVERKLIMMQDIIRMVQKKNQELKRKIKTTKGRKGIAVSVANPQAAGFDSNAQPESDNASTLEMNSVENVNITTRQKSKQEEGLDLLSTLEVNCAQSGISTKEKSRLPQELVNVVPISPVNGDMAASTILSAKVDRTQGFCHASLSLPCTGDDVPTQEQISHIGQVTRHLPHLASKQVSGMPYMQRQDQVHMSSETNSKSFLASLNLTNKMNECAKVAEILCSRLGGIVTRMDVLEKKLNSVNLCPSPVVTEWKDGVDRHPDKVSCMEKQLKSVMDRLVLMENQIAILNTLGSGQRLPSGLTTVKEVDVSNNNHYKTLDQDQNLLVLSPPLSSTPACDVFSSHASIKSSSHDSYATPVGAQQTKIQIERVNDLIKGTQYLLQPIPVTMNNSQLFGEGIVHDASVM